MRMKTVVLAMALCLMGAATGMAQRGNGQMDPAKRIEQMVKKLGLDEAQAKQFREAMAEMRPAARPADGQRPSKEEMEKMREEMKQKREAVDQKVKAILTEEQYKKYQEMNQRPQGGRRQ